MRRLLGLVIAAAVGTAACGVGDGQGRADVLARSRRATAAVGPVRGALTIDLELDEESLDELEGEQRDLFADLAGVADRSDGGDPPNRLTLAVTAELGRAQAHVRSGEHAVAIFDGDSIYVRRQNARATERRVWATIDLHDLDNDARPLLTRELEPRQLLAAVAHSVNPTFLVELAAGALAGATEATGTETIAGVDTRRYRSRVALEQAFDELDLTDDEVESRYRLHRLLRTDREVLPAEFWVDSEGRLRQIRVQLDQKVSRRRSHSLTVTLLLSELGVDVAVDPPPAEATVSYEAFGRLVASGFPAES